MLVVVVIGRLKDFRFVIKGKNGKVIAESQRYFRRECCIRAVDKLTNNLTWRVHTL